jgi:hypothetical protein
VKLTIVCANQGRRIVAGGLVCCLVGCGSDSSPIGFSAPAVSSVYTDFKPEDAFRRRGFRVESAASGGRVSPREMYGWRPWQGSLTLPEGTHGCEVAADAIRDELGEALGHMYSDELGLERNRAPGTPMYGMLRYVYQGMRGDVHVWLFPDDAETQINYAILLSEERSS